MDYFTTKRLSGLYGFTTDFSSFIPDSICYPPNSNVPKGLMNRLALKGKLSTDTATLNPKLEDFTQMYQQMAAGLIDMSIDRLIPPGHPMHSKENSISLLKEENNKILKENFELKKKLENKRESKKI